LGDNLNIARTLYEHERTWFEHGTNMYEHGSNTVRTLYEQGTNLKPTTFQPVRNPMLSRTRLLLPKAWCCALLPPKLQPFSANPLHMALKRWEKVPREIEVLEAFLSDPGCKAGLEAHWQGVTLRCYHIPNPQI